MFYQDREDGCGEASARNIISYFYRKEKGGYGPLANRCFSFAEIQEALQAYGVEGTGYGFQDLSDLKGLPFPWILETVNDGKAHFAVIRRKIGPFFLLEDPAKGRTLLLKGRLKKISLGKVLSCQLKEKKELKRISPLKKAEKAALLVLTSLSSAAALGGLLTLGLTSFPFCPPLCGLAFLLGTWLNRALALRIKSRMDQRLAVPYLTQRSSAQEMKKAEDFISGVLSGEMEKDERAAGLGEATVLACCSSRPFLALLGLALGVGLVIFLVFSPLERSLENKISREEKEALEGPVFARDKFLQASEAGRDYGEYLLAEKGLLIFLIFLFVFLFSLPGDGGISYFGLLSEGVFLCFLASSFLSQLKGLGKKADPWAGLLKMDAAIYNCPGLYG